MREKIERNSGRKLAKNKTLITFVSAFILLSTVTFIPTVYGKITIDRVETEKSELISNILEFKEELYKYIDKVEVASFNDDFEKYWEEYKRGKKIWNGNFVDKDNNILPNTPKLVEDSWEGENFYEWYLNGCDYLYGLDDDRGQSAFFKLNTIGFYTIAILIIITALTYSAGIFLDESWFFVCGIAGLAGGVISIVQLRWDWYIFLYLLYGVNAFLNMLERGNIDLEVELTGDKEIISQYTVEAYSIEAQEKFDQTGGKFDGANWSMTEFTYNLVQTDEEPYQPNSDHYSIDYPYYEPSDEDGTNHKQWTKAVPPPGDWKIMVLDQAGTIVQEKEVNIDPRNSCNVQFIFE